MRYHMGWEVHIGWTRTDRICLGCNSNKDRQGAIDALNRALEEHADAIFAAMRLGETVVYTISARIEE